MKQSSYERSAALYKAMKYSFLTFSILCTLCGALVASPGMAQKLEKSSVSLKVTKGRSTSQLLKEIEAGTGLRFIYNPDVLLESKREVNETFKNEKVESVLRKLGFSCTEKGGFIILKSIPLPVKKADRVIRGMVTDSTGLAMPGVSVKVLGTAKSTTTDVNGKYSIPVGDDAVLSFSMVGYKTRQVRVTDADVYNVTLMEDKSLLNEVVVVGYGTQKRATLTGAVSVVPLDQISSRSVNSVGEILAGKSPGVIVTNEGGDPTSGPRVNIRGSGGINGESVLYVVDGSIVPGTPVLNPNDIESISVLKDGSAAIYGARASGGVILISTKKGKKGRMEITVDGKIGTQSAWKKLKSLDAAQRASLAATAAKNGNSTILPAFDPVKYPDGQITRTNWMDEVFRTGLTQDYNLGVSGGSEKSNVYLSFNYRNAEGILLNTKVQRYNFRINSDHQLTSWLKIGKNLSFSSTNGQGANTSSDYTGALLSAIYYPANATPYNADGSFAGLPGGQYAGDYGDIINPVADLMRMDVNRPENILLINPYAVFNLAKGLTFRSNLSVTKGFYHAKIFTPKRPEVGKPLLTNSLEESDRRLTDILAEQVLTYKKDLGLHHLDFTGGFSFQKTKYNGFSVIGRGFDDEAPAKRYLVNASVFEPAVSDLVSTALSSLFIRANYNYADKYLLSIIGRRDGSSLVPKPENKFQPYYSISGGWVLSKENFLKESTWLSELKIRGSYGLLGNLGSLQPLDVSPLLVKTIAYFGQTPTLQNGYVSNVLENPELTWAESKQTNIGLDLGMLKNSLTLTADYFIKNTDKMILKKPLPGTAGLSTQTINAGLVRDNGIELGLTYTSDKGKAFNYSVNASLTKVNNKVIKLAPGLESIAVTNNFRNELAPLYIKEGQPLYSYFVRKTQGIFQTQAEVDNYKNSKGVKIQPKARPGDFKFADLDDSGSIDGGDRYFAGGAYPDFSYGLSFNASYKNFDLNIFAQGVQNNKLFNAVKRTTFSASGPSYNKLEGILDAWSPEHPNGKVPIISTSDENGNFNASDFYIEDGSYLRLRNITLGYSLPKSITSKLKAGAIRVYVTSNNLFTITKYSGFDPEIGMDNYGLDVGRYPQSRSFLFGLSVNL
ncbi:SusC/RagA family TonB-linked outer membrane protein [Pedobacter nyackensis]|uniref:TonB-linked outer membrane protein, SusC/RagA family n=1 Tax=Pedobacter nyackensis TaxID=475255 RepID=A0A1W2E3N7_9SPHI|nr:TonB-dependent receptor [Pedobacter nyackensis]SMD04012.1 TonB-linked outer membrane protein, SusC/RagA family [Pedobacter nyackensis]